MKKPFKNLRIKDAQKNMLIWFVLFAVAFMFFYAYEQSKIHQVKDFNYPKLLQALEDKHVVKDSIVFNTTASKIERKRTRDL